MGLGWGQYGQPLVVSQRGRQCWHQTGSGWEPQPVSTVGCSRLVGLQAQVVQGWGEGEKEMVEGLLLQAGPGMVQPQV